VVALAIILAVAAVAAAVVVADPMSTASDETAAGWRADADPEDLLPADDEPADEPDDEPAATTSPTTTAPPTTTTAPPTRLAPAPTAPAEAGFHTFLGREADDDPIAWDPCETIQYVVNSRTAPPGGAEVLAEAIAQITTATGLVFEDMGATDEVPTVAERPLEDPTRYGDGWSPVLIAWTDAAEVAHLEGGVGGVGEALWVPTGGGEYESVSGLVHLDGPDIASFLDQGWRTQVLDLVMHELGHLVGLHHVEDTREVMYHNTDGGRVGNATWGNGDLAGLAALGTGDCDPDI
jgi:hypothetical protein